LPNEATVADEFARVKPSSVGALHIVHRMVEAETLGPTTLRNNLEIQVLGHDKTCAVIAGPDFRTFERALRRPPAKTRTIELRLDWLRDDREIDKFLRKLARKQFPLTLIATCRRREAGGRYRGTIARQLAHLAEALRAGCQWYDLEIETARQLPPELLDALLGDGRQLRSAHFFKRLPQDLPRVAARLQKGAPDQIKIAAHCDSLADSRKLARFARRQKDLIAIPMGDVAFPARILALRERNGFAYAPVEQATAPGQPSLADLENLYRADRINAKTEVYGVIGSPISHSLSPVMQNAGFQARRINAIYVPFLVDDLGDFLDSIDAFAIRGFSVTLPHKERILKHLDGCDPLAARIGAVNTVVVREGGKLYGYNTDYVGVLRALGRRIALGASRVLILGAGGAARAVGFALAQAGSRVCVCARREARARVLAREFGGEAIRRAGLASQFFDAIVNATPAGMYPRVGNSPLRAHELNCRLVFDTIYRPRRTRLLELAARRRIQTVSGVEMFVAQGTAQWEIWMGERAPLTAMRRAVVAALAREESRTQRGARKAG
jgi:3-dehydroquinate dehydratase / shikimate dehydrogenase